jgi:glycosyltransferase involved in cell wall biosynthesis
MPVNKDSYILFQQHKTCVLIPTYNNAGTLANVINSVLEYTDQVIVVNDGATDNTKEILATYSHIHIVNNERNRGKGFALRTGIKEAAKLGYDYAISIDSDGQHYAYDLPKFLKRVAETPNVLIIGARNMNQENVPGKSSFGNRFSNFWFALETGIKLPDTQSGYRLYPVKELAKSIYFTRKYEFEIEVIVRAAWSGLKVISIPVSVYYPPADERVSHFRPFKDFTRISILNTVLVLITFLWIKPRNFFRGFFKKEAWQNAMRSLFVNPQESNHLKAASIGFGVFMGIVPVWGFQLAIGVPLALLFRLNKALFIIAANISIFPFTAFVLLASVLTGNWLLGIHSILPDWHHLTLTDVKHEGFAFFLGGAILAIVAGAIAYLLTFIILLLTRPKRFSAKLGR